LEKTNPFEPLVSKLLI